jgi:hypothetical protein
MEILQRGRVLVTRRSLSFLQAAIEDPLYPAFVLLLLYGLRPRSVPAEVVLIRTERVAVAVGCVRAYPNGSEFTVHIHLRREDETSWPGRERRMLTPQDRQDDLRLGDEALHVRDVGLRPTINPAEVPTITSADDRSPRTPQADDDSSLPGDTNDTAAAKHHPGRHVHRPP